MKDSDWKAVGLGALVIVLLIILTVNLAGSVRHQSWITAQICLLGILALLSITVWQVRRAVVGSPVQKPREGSEDLGITTIAKLVQFTSCGVVAIIIYAIQYNYWKSAAVAQVAAVGLLTAGASLAAGALLGFIFGVPRSPNPPSTTVGGTSTTGAAASTNGDGKFGANTNLEQISDWLTKTLVGVSLVELSKIPPLLDKLAWYVAAGMGDAGPHAKSVALVIMVYFVSAGFLISYLWTRMELTRVFNESTLSKRISDLEKQSGFDADAIARVDKWLNHHPAKQDEDKTRSEMIDAIKASSDATKSQVFVTGDDCKRSATTEAVKAARDATAAVKTQGATAAPAATAAIEKKKAVVNQASELTLPIFQALVEADGQRIFHRNRGQYAFCLMTQSKPDWQKALDVLQEAIAIRDRSHDQGWAEYEFARAICRIKLDPQAKSKPDVKDAIDADLKKAQDLKLEDDRRDRLDLDQEIAKWIP